MIALTKLHLGFKKKIVMEATARGSLLSNYTLSLPNLNPGPKAHISLARTHTQRNARSRETHVAFQEAADIGAHLPQEKNGLTPRVPVWRGPGLPLRGSHRPQGRKQEPTRRRSRQESDLEPRKSLAQLLHSSPSERIPHGCA